MGEALVHDELVVSCPEGFAVMGADEMKHAFLDDNPHRWGLWDKERHLMFVVTWHVSNAAIARLATPTSLAKRAGKIAAKTYRGRNYRQLGDYYKTQLCGLDAAGFRYEFELQDSEQQTVVQQGETVIFKNGACCYTLYWYERKGTCPEAEQVRNDIFGSLALA